MKSDRAAQMLFRVMSPLPTQVIINFTKIPATTGTLAGKGHFLGDTVFEHERISLRGDVVIWHIGSSFGVMDR